ncbi:MAG: M48 family metallopeptidase [Firmicutes bacterium]|nr:M48 family metallopeptidase [Bacillota bacterium]
MKWVIIGLLLVVYLFEAVVAVLNRNNSKKALPQRLQDIYDQKRYQKWLAYSLDIQRFTIVRRGLNLLILIVLLGGFFSLLEKLAASWSGNPVLQSLYFLGIYQTFLTLLGLPFRIYQTFSIEERHGFNRTAKKTFLKDTALNYLLTLILGGIIIGGIHLLYLRFARDLGVFILLAWGAVSLIMLLIFAFFNRLFLRLFNKFTPLAEGTLRTRIEDLASGVGFNVKSISVMDASKRSTKCNAAFTGLGRAKEVILFDTLLERMTEDEIVAVLAHELGHAVHGDTRRMLGLQIIAAGFYAAGIGLILENTALFTSFGFSGTHFGFAIILFSLLFQPIGLILGIPLNLVLRQAEYRADQFSARKTRGSWLISALKVLARENLANLNPHPLAVVLYYSHPPLNERIKALQ